ncbi:UNVERIFIED_CONTAM: RNA-binding ATPase activator esf2, partial [Siphonaria sp. JEL0065]
MPPKPKTPSKATLAKKAAVVDSRFHHPFDDDSDNDNYSDQDEETGKPGLKSKTTGGSIKKPTSDPRFAAANDKKWASKFTAGNDSDEDDDEEVEEDQVDGNSGDDDQGQDEDEEDLPEELNLPPDQQPDILNQDPSTSTQATKGPITLESLKSYSETVNNTGLCYISRVPPFMTPEKLRSLLSVHGKLGRLYAAPEDAKTAYRRKKYRGNKRVNYTEAWVEFEDKKVARRVAGFLNLRPMGTRKRD